MGRCRMVRQRGQVGHADHVITEHQHATIPFTLHAPRVGVGGQCTV